MLILERSGDWSVLNRNSGMDRRSWLWKRKSSEKCPGETESSGSVSSISERFSDDQEALRSSPVHASPNNVQSLDISSKVENHEVNETVKILNEKLTAALINITAKEDLVKQHSKVAEEAVAGWEKAENEVASLKKQLEATAQKNCALDGALKECVRQFRQSREEHEEKLNDILSEKTNEWESKKCELETKITELQNSLEACKNNNDLHLKLQVLMNENSTLIIERDLSNKAAELASKQHLDSIKKISKLEAECRKLRASIKKSSPYKENNKSLNSSFYVESVADSQSDCCSESWASSIFELDHSKNENNKALSRNLTSHVNIEMMNDFLEMEKLVASSDGDVKENMMFEEKIKKIVSEKREVELVLSKTRDNLVETENKLAELQRQLNSTNASKCLLQSDMDAMESKKKELEFQLKAKNFEVKKLQSKVGLLETKCRDKEASELKREQLETELNAKIAEIKRLQEKIETLKIKSKDMDDLILKREEHDAHLKSAHLEIEKLKEKINLLERNIKDEKNISARYQAKGQNVEIIEAEKIGLESQLISSQLEMEELQERISLLEGKLEEQMILSLNFQGRSKALENEKEALKSQLQSAQYESEKLRSKWGLLEKEIEVERETHSGLAVKCNVFEALLKAKIEEQEAQVKEASVLKSQFEFANLESKELHENLKVMEKEIERERKVSADFLTKNEILNKEIARLKQEIEHKQPKSFTRELNTTKDVDLSQASGKLAECQKTIYSISSQLRLLKDFNSMLDYEDSDLGDKANFINTSFSNYHDKSLRLASPSSSLNETESCFPQNRSCIQIQSQ